MKKSFIVLFGIAIIAFLSSCSYSQKSSSISFSFPDDASERLTAFRALEDETAETDTAADADKPYFITFDFTGGWEYSQTTAYAALTDLNGAVFQFDDLKPGETINVAVALGYGSYTLYKGEQTVTLVNGENPVTLTLAKQTIEFKIAAAYQSSPETVYDGTNVIPLVDDELTFTTDNGETDGKWTINGTEFDGTINPLSTTDSVLIKYTDSNVVVFTLNSSVLGNKASTFEFSFDSSAIKDFSISASYLSKAETVYDGSAAIPYSNDTLNFTSTNTYENSDVSWTINGKAFDGSLNPTASDAVIIPGTNTVVCTVTDKTYKMITKSAAFEFGFESLPAALNITLTNNDADKTALDANNTVELGKAYNLSIFELKSLPSDTTYEWTLNGAAYTPSETGILAPEDFFVDGTFVYVLLLKAASARYNWTASGSITMNIQNGSSSVVVQKAIPDFEIYGETSLNYENNTSIFYTARPVKYAEGETFAAGTSFQWFINGTEIKGATSSTLYLNPVMTDGVQLGKNIIKVIAVNGSAMSSVSMEVTINQDSVSILSNAKNL